MKIPVSYYKKSSNELYWNDGTLYIKNSKIILKNLFKTVAVFDAYMVKFITLTDELFYKATEISDNKKSYILLFDKLNYKKLCEFADILPNP
ncbi:MAG: hypothetical protein E7538_05280 [Ruminococcaceae bacterium]|nr:hypothetical protein [Oscillospiraceae bacterium]